MPQNKPQVAQMVEPYIGKYFSTYGVRHDILGFSDGPIAETDKRLLMSVTPVLSRPLVPLVQKQQVVKNNPCLRTSTEADANGDGQQARRGFDFIEGDMDLPRSQPAMNAEILKMMGVQRFPKRLNNRIHFFYVKSI